MTLHLPTQYADDPVVQRLMRDLESRTLYLEQLSNAPKHARAAWRCETKKELTIEEML